MSRVYNIGHNKGITTPEFFFNVHCRWLWSASSTPTLKGKSHHFDEIASLAPQEVVILTTLKWQLPVHLVMQISSKWHLHFSVQYTPSNMLTICTFIIPPASMKLKRGYTGFTLSVPPPSGSTLYSEGSFVRRFFSPKAFEVPMYGVSKGHLSRFYWYRKLFTDIGKWITDIGK